MTLQSLISSEAEQLSQPKWVDLNPDLRLNSTQAIVNSSGAYLKKSCFLVQCEIFSPVEYFGGV